MYTPFSKVTNIFVTVHILHAYDALMHLIEKLCKNYFSI